MHSHWIVSHVQFLQVKKETGAIREKRAVRDKPEFETKESDEGCKIFADRPVICGGDISVCRSRKSLFPSNLLLARRGIHVNCRLSIDATYPTASLPVTNYRFTTLRAHCSRFEPFSVENGRDGLGINLTNVLIAGFLENCFLTNEFLTANKIICFCLNM